MSADVQMEIKGCGDCHRHWIDEKKAVVMSTAVTDRW